MLSRNINMLSRNIYKRNIFTNKKYLQQSLTHSEVSSTSKPKPYNEIPKVKGLPLIGSLTDYFNIEGGLFQLHKHYYKRVEEYGPIFREKIGFKNEIVFIVNPGDLEKVLKDEKSGEYKDRGQPLWSFRAYNKNHDMPNAFFDMDQEEFLRRKESIKKTVLNPKAVAKLTEMYDEVSKDLLGYLDRKKDSQTNIVPDFMSGLHLWSLQCGGITVFRKNFGILAENEVTDPSIKKILSGEDGFFRMFFELEMTPTFHKFQKSKLWKRFDRQATQLLEGTAELIEKHGEYILDKDANLSEKERLSACFTVFTASIDTTKETAMWSLIEISKHPEVQDKLYEEITRTIGDQEVFDHKVVQHMPYLRACLKEVFRIHPLVQQQGRITQRDLVLSGYEVPANTHIHLLLGSTGKVFPVGDNESFIPERWMRNSGCPVSQKPHPFSIVPFGHGMRACMGRRLAENELYTLFANVFRKYKIELVNEEINTEFNFFHVVNEPVSFRLIER